MVIANRLEPIYLTEKGLLQTGTAFGTTTRLFNAGLAYQDEREASHPFLAEALPRLNSESWRVSPDGRMETTYRLRPNLTWHDGAPLSADDFVFAHRVYAAPEFGRSNSPPQNWIEEVIAPDSRTVVVRWRQTFPEADALLPADFPPLPRHILEGPLQRGDPDAFVAHAYWQREYIGLGAFRLENWEPGSFLEATAFDAYVLGRPKIERIRIIFVPDPNTILANLMAGAAHLTTDESIRLPQGAILRSEWEARQAGSVLLRLTGARRTEVQLHRERVNPPVLLDLRVRRAAAHAIDKEALNQGLIEGLGKPADTLVQPHVEYFPDVERAIVKYPYDLRRTEQLLNEVGYSKGGDGFYASPTAGRFAMELRVLAGSQNEAEIAIMADGLKHVGFDMSSYVVPAAQIQDGQIRASFPALSTTTGGTLDSLHSAAIPTPQNRWQGNNRSSWVNPEYDRLFDAFTTALARAERYQHLVQMARIYSEDVPSIPLYYNVSVVAHAAALKGVIAGTSWNVHLWEFH